MHARHRLEQNVGVIRRPLVVAIDSQPKHLAASGNFLFADHWNVVFRLTGDDAGVAADAYTGVNHHRPRAAVELVLGIE